MIPDIHYQRICFRCLFRANYPGVASLNGGGGLIDRAERTLSGEVVVIPRAWKRRSRHPIQGQMRAALIVDIEQCVTWARYPKDRASKTHLDLPSLITYSQQELRKHVNFAKNDLNGFVVDEYQEILQHWEGFCANRHRGYFRKEESPPYTISDVDFTLKDLSEWEFSFIQTHHLYNYMIKKAIDYGRTDNKT